METDMATDIVASSPRKARKPPGRNTKPQRGDKQYGKSAVTNGSEILPGLDGRSGAGRRYRDLVNIYLEQLGGAKQVHEPKLGVLRQLAQITVKAEQLGAAMAKGEKVNTAELCTLASTVLRLSMRLGFEHSAEPKNDMKSFLAKRKQRLAAVPAVPTIESPTEPELA
jgi:hypothetical protein